jgi:two-component system cell cycle response regulator
MELITFLLKSFGHTVLTRSDGDGVVKFVRQEKPDIVLCDVQLPTIDGYEVARQLRADGALFKIPLIAVTAFAMVGDKNKLLAAGFNGYISKPIEPATFVHQIQEFLQPAQRQPSPVFAASEPSGHSAAVSPVRGNILVVDDSAVNLSLMRTLLEPSGYHVLTAESVNKALAMARQSAPDLILTDVHMPDRSGYELLRVLSEDPDLRSIPCILISSTSGDAGTKNLALAAGARLFIARPIEPRQLLAEIERHIQKKDVS